jgi:predicted dienelactone hydrolase
MKTVLALLMIFAAVLPMRLANGADLVGVSTLAVPVPERKGTMEVTLWYPAAAGGEPAVVGESALFHGVSAWRAAPAAAGSRPLILLSQGGLRSGPNIGAWMASRLATRGFVVAMLRQPNPHSQLPQEVLHEVWLRPADISATLTAIENDVAMSARIDANSVGVLGLQLGGTAALAVVGARLDPESFVRSCDPGGTGMDCGWFAKSGVDLRAVDKTRLARSNVDRRIKAVVVIDPELSTSFTRESLARISVPVRAINLGKPTTICAGLNASQLAVDVPNMHYERVLDASQFGAFGECKPQAAEILRTEGEEPLCDDAGGRSRAEIHEQLSAMVEMAFRLSMPQ